MSAGERLSITLATFVCFKKTVQVWEVLVVCFSYSFGSFGIDWDLVHWFVFDVSMCKFSAVNYMT